MEVPVDLAPFLGPTLVRLEPMTIRQLQNTKVCEAIDEFARLSAHSKHLQQPLTTCEKLINSGNILYLLWEPIQGKEESSRIIGMLKVGRKRLFLYDKDLKTYEGELTSLLDFHVHLSCQRQGYGRKLFDYMLQCEKVEPYEIAFDSPDVTLLAFLSKYYGQINPIWQNTNFVVFPQLFAENKANGETVPEGWSRSTPQHIGRNSIDGQSSKLNKGMLTEDAAGTMNGQSNADRTLANRASTARMHKQVILSSTPLW